MPGPWDHDAPADIDETGFGRPRLAPGSWRCPACGAWNEDRHFPRCTECDNPDEPEPEETPTMTAPTFKPAQKTTAKLRLALMGPSGSGKTYSALGIAHGLGQKVALIDTEAGSAAKYADLFPFDTVELTHFDPRGYVEAIHAAEDAGYEVIIIDSLSHAWSGKGGCLELVDEITEAKSHGKAGNKFSGWKDVTPIHNALIDAIVRSKAHIIATLRTKTEYVLEVNDRGKQVPRKVGLAPVQRDGMEYEFDFLVDMDGGRGLVTKSRWAAVDQETVKHPGKAFGEKLMSWLSDGVAQDLDNPPRIPLDPPGTKKVEPDPKAPITPGKLKAFWSHARGAGLTDDFVKAHLEGMGLASSKDIKEGQFQGLMDWIDATAAGPAETAADGPADPAPSAATAGQRVDGH